MERFELSGELLNKNQVFQRQSNFIRSARHNLSKRFLHITPVHRWQGFLTLMHSQLISFANYECINLTINYTGKHQQFHHINVSISHQKG